MTASEVTSTHQELTKARHSRATEAARTLASIDSQHAAAVVAWLVPLAAAVASTSPDEEGESFTEVFAHIELEKALADAGDYLALLHRRGPHQATHEGKIVINRLAHAVARRVGRGPFPNWEEGGLYCLVLELP